MTNSSFGHKTRQKEEAIHKIQDSMEESVFTYTEKSSLKT